jgi:hypothetical protein
MRCTEAKSIGIAKSIGTKGTENNNSKSGSLDEATALRCLSWVRLMVGNEPVALVLDSYTTHVAMGLREKSEAMGIEFAFVPGGGIDQCDPLHRRCRGRFKRGSQRPSNESFVANPTKQSNHPWLSL